MIKKVLKFLYPLVVRLQNSLKNKIKYYIQGLTGKLLLGPQPAFNVVSEGLGRGGIDDVLRKGIPESRAGVEEGAT